MKEKFYFDINIASKQEFNAWPHSSTYKALQIIKPNSKVLDIGCAKGYMARELAKKGCQTWGIEIDAEACKLAKRYCQEVICGNIEEIDNLPFQKDLCLDVLEHLIRPDLVLYKLKPYLSPQGKLIVSLPNIARFEYRLRLFLGKFNYSPSGGVLSKGHLRFFTLKTAKELIESSGYRIDKMEPTGLGSILKLFPTLLGFQFLFIAYKKQV